MYALACGSGNSIHTYPTRHKSLELIVLLFLSFFFYTFASFTTITIWQEREKLKKKRGGKAKGKQSKVDNNHDFPTWEEPAAAAAAAWWDDSL